jgi:hypothetical protein
VSVATADPDRPATRWRLFARAEDWLLAGWIALAAPALALVGGTAGPFDSGHPLQGVLELTGFVGALACLGTRSADGDGGPGSVAPTTWSVTNSGAVGPLVGGLMLVGASAFAELGLDPAAALLPAFAAVLVLSLAQSRLPGVPTAVRRALVTPYLLAAGGLFWGVVHEVTAGVDLRGQFGASFASASTEAAQVAGLLVLAAAVYYAMLIYAPRQIAEREGGPLAWLARFGLFLVSVLFGLGWLPLLGG